MTGCSCLGGGHGVTLSSLGIMIGGLGTMAPERRNDIVSLGLKSIVSGTLATCLMGAIVGAIVNQ
jgi:concentrative nucleoside transporter, CNT family